MVVLLLEGAEIFFFGVETIVIVRVKPILMMIDGGVYDSKKIEGGKQGPTDVVGFL